MSEKKKVMIVEDSDTVKFELKLILNQYNLEIVQAGNKVGMLNLIEEYGKIVNLIIMDLTLKQENGLDLIESLKGNDNYKDIPVIIITEDIAVANILKAKELGVIGYLKKPINKSELLDKIAPYLDIIIKKEGEMG